MEKIFGLPIIIAVALGFAFPYQAMAIMPLGFVFLFLMMLWAGLTIQWERLRGVAARPLDVLAGLALLYLFFPPLQWALARLLVTDHQYLFGLLFASLTPAAIVAPFFTQVVGGDEELSFLVMVTSTLLCPVAAPVLLKLLAGSVIAVETASLARFLALLVTLPLLLSYGISKAMPAARDRIRPHLALLNMLSLSVLIYIFFGNAVGRLNLNYVSAVDVGTLLILVFVQDFGVLFLARFILAARYDMERLNALATTVSMKNVAIAAAVLLFYDPKAALPPALAFIAHACLFNFIPLARGSLSGKKDLE